MVSVYWVEVLLSKSLLQNGVSFDLAEAIRTRHAYWSDYINGYADMPRTPDAFTVWEFGGLGGIWETWS